MALKERKGIGKNAIHEFTKVAIAEQYGIKMPLMPNVRLCLTERSRSDLATKVSGRVGISEEIVTYILKRLIGAEEIGGVFLLDKGYDPVDLVEKKLVRCFFLSYYGSLREVTPSCCSKRDACVYAIPTEELLEIIAAAA